MSVRVQPSLSDGLNRDAEPLGHIVMSEPLAYIIDRFPKLHVYIPIDSATAVYDNIYVQNERASPMNRVPLARRVQVISCLVEGNSIRSTERMTGTHRDTICRLLVEVGEGCAKLMDEQMRELSCRRIEVDEIWAYVGKKQRHMTEDDDPRRLGDQYTFVALDPETKIVPAYRVGKAASASDES